MQVAPARRFDAAHRTQIFAAAGNRRRRDRALGDQPALAIEVAQHQFQQFGALHDSGGQLLPLGLVDQERQMAQRRKPVGSFAGRTIGHAGFPQMPVGGFKTALDIGGRQFGEGVEEARPDLARRAVLPDILVGNSGQRRIAARPLRHAPVARTGPASRSAAFSTIFSTIFLAVVSRHPRLSCAPQA